MDRDQALTWVWILKSALSGKDLVIVTQSGDDGEIAVYPHQKFEDAFAEGTSYYEETWTVSVNDSRGLAVRLNNFSIDAATRTISAVSEDASTKFMWVVVDDAPETSYTVEVYSQFHDSWARVGKVHDTRTQAQLFAERTIVNAPWRIVETARRVVANGDVADGTEE